MMSLGGVFFVFLVLGLIDLGSVHSQFASNLELFFSL